MKELRYKLIPSEYDWQAKAFFGILKGMEGRKSEEGTATSEEPLAIEIKREGRRA